MSRRRLLAGTLTIALTASVCSLTHEPTASAGREDIRAPKRAATAHGLAPFGSCDELQEWIADEGAPRVATMGWNGTWLGRGMVDDVVMEDLASPLAADSSSSSNRSGSPGELRAGTERDGDDPTFSGTNVQEGGVDEPDVVKTDGSRMVAAVDGRLYVLDVTGDTPEITGSVSFRGGSDHELLLAGNRVFALSSSYAGDGIIPTDLASDSGVAPGGGSFTTIEEIDISDPSTPTVVDVESVEGQYLTTRVVDGTARVVVTTSAAPIESVTPSGPSAVQAATEVNARLLRETDADHWLPHTVDGQGRVSTDAAVGCEDVARPASFSGFGTITVLSFAVDEPLDASDAVSVLADGNTVYASAEALYVATNEWADPSAIEPLVEAQEAGDRERADELQADLDDGYATTIHRFDISDGGPARYEGSGTVPGHLLNQFSLSEDDGVLRVASTVGSPWGPSSSESLVTTLGVEGQQLERLGEVRNLGAGEEIQAVRFFGNRAYVVTFRQTDPLFVIDLSDPADPVLAGSLEIPGYSAYLHPIGDDRLLGIGQDATPDGMRTGSQISLFDVADPTHPTRLDQVLLGAGTSEVEWNHRAFLWWAPDGLAFVPLQSWDEGHPVSGGIGIGVEGDHLVERGRVAPPAREGCPDLSGVAIEEDITPTLIRELTGTDEPLPEHCQTPPTSYLRAIVIGDEVLTVSPEGVGTHSLDTLTRQTWLDWE